MASLDDLLREHGAGAVRFAVWPPDAAAASSPPSPVKIPADWQPLPPLQRPANQLFVGVNYADHVAELPPPWKMTEQPFVFSKLNSSIIGPGEPIRLPKPGASVDYEAELLVVIGERASRLTPENALDHVFGYTIVNDVTERAVQATDNQLTMAKGMDTFCPMGPSIVGTDEIDDPVRARHLDDRQRRGAPALQHEPAGLLRRRPARLADADGHAAARATRSRREPPPASARFATRPCSSRRATSSPSACRASAS